jgi:UPF0755 protein
MEFLQRHRLWIVAFLLSVCVVVGYKNTIAPPSDFAQGTRVHITGGTSVAEIAQELTNAHLILHPTLLRILLRITGESSNVQTGLYAFENPQNLFTIARRLLRGDYQISPTRITFIEGVTIREMALQVAQALPYISADDFLLVAKGQEGYLFPDTYLFQPGTTATSVVASMRRNFDTKTKSLTDEVSTKEHSFTDIVTMASIIEKEARTNEDRHLVAGILWNRINLGMPLQVDAVFGYIFNRETYSPSYADLKVNSPYNTYLHKGLPPGPINNPGFDALLAAAHPTKTNYLYYLTGNDGLMHYATTYTGHEANFRKYLRQ